MTNRVSCGCYSVYQRPRRSGRAFYVTKRGDQDIVLSRIKSVYLHKCGEESMRNALSELVIIGAILLMLLIVVGGILFIKKINMPHLHLFLTRWELP